MRLTDASVQENRVEGETEGHQWGENPSGHLKRCQAASAALRCITLVGQVAAIKKVKQGKSVVWCVSVCGCASASVRCEV